MICKINKKKVFHLKIQIIVRKKANISEYNLECKNYKQNS